MGVQDIDLWEINEAFAVVPLKTMRDLATGLVTLCIGGGMGIATIIERV